MRHKPVDGRLKIDWPRARANRRRAFRRHGEHLVTLHPHGDQATYCWNTSIVRISRYLPSVKVPMKERPSQDDYLDSRTTALPRHQTATVSGLTVKNAGETLHR